MSTNIVIKSGSWQTMSAAVKPIRETVFIVEQQVPIELEWDDEDESAIHFAAITDNNQVIGCARLTKTGHIGRLAVLSEYRGTGTGQAIMRNILDTAEKHDFSSLVLNAQTHALTFYEQFGFVARGEIFDDAGIPHRTMFLKK